MVVHGPSAAPLPCPHNDRHDRFEHRSAELPPQLVHWRKRAFKFTLDHWNGHDHHHQPDHRSPFPRRHQHPNDHCLLHHQQHRQRQCNPRPLPHRLLNCPPASRHLSAGRQLCIRRVGSGTVQLRFCRRRVWTRLDRHEQCGCHVQWEPQCTRCSDLDFQRRHPERRSRRHRHAHALMLCTSPASPPPPSSGVPDSPPACGPPSCASSIQQHACITHSN
jgi:hypothetical protein